jgi:hypothetical protein
MEADPFFAPEVEPLHAETRLLAEACQRLHEWSEVTSLSRVVAWIQQMSVLGAGGGSALLLYLKTQSGDLSEFTEPLALQGAALGVSKQNLNHIQQTTLRAIRRRLPELGEAMDSLRRVHGQGHGGIGALSEFDEYSQRHHEELG